MATAGDRVFVFGREQDRSDLNGTIKETRGSEGNPPYVVEFDDGHEGIIFPGTDTETMPR